MSTEHLTPEAGQVLQALLGADDKQRREAEAHLDQLLVADAPSILLLLAQIGALGVGGFQIDERILALILLRRLTFTANARLHLNSAEPHPTAPFDMMSEIVRNRIEGVICAGLKDEMDVKVRKGLSTAAVGWLDGSSIRQRPFVSLPEVLFNLTTAPQASHRITPYQILSDKPALLFDSNPTTVSSEQMAHILVSGLQDQSMDVKIESIKAIATVLDEAMTGRDRKRVGPGLIGATIDILRTLPPQAFSLALVPLVQVATNYPTLFSTNLQSAVPFLLSLASITCYAVPTYLRASSQPGFAPLPATMAAEEQDEVANPATEILLCLLSYGPILRKIGQDTENVVNEVLKALLGRMIGGMGEPGAGIDDWLREEDLASEDDDYPVFPEEALDRLSMAVGGRNLLPSFSSHLRALIIEPDWRCRYSGLVAIAAVAAGTAEALESNLGELISVILPAQQDMNARVRYALCQSVGQLCDDFPNTMQSQHSSNVLPVLVKLLRDSEPRVRAHAAAAVVNMFQGDVSEAWSPYIDELVSALIDMLRSQQMYAQEQALNTIASVATAVESAFQPYYRPTMSLLYELLNNATSEEQRLLVGKAVECATLVVLSLGKATAGTDAVQLASIFGRLQAQVTEADDPRASYLLNGWAALCQTLGRDFAPFLSVVLPPLLLAASHKPELREIDAHDEDDYSPDDGWYTIDVGGRTVAVNTSSMEEKEQAFIQLTVYADTMEQDFEPWLPRAMELSLEALAFQFSLSVREAAAYLVPSLLHVGKVSNTWQARPDLIALIFETLLKAISEETESSFAALLYKSFDDSLRVASGSLPEALRSQFAFAVARQLADLQSHRLSVAGGDEELDEYEQEILAEEREEQNAMLDEMAKAIDRVGGMDAALQTIASLRTSS